MPLSRKRQAFVREYVIDWNATQAAIRAGYSAHTAKQLGSRLLTYIDIQQAVAALAQRAASEAWDTAEGIREKARQGIEMALAQGRPDRAARLLELLARRHGELTERTIMDVDDRVSRLVQLTGVSDAEARAAVREAEEQLRGAR